MPFKYLYIDSKHEFQNKDGTDRLLSKYKIKCNAHPLRQVKRVGVISATIPNTHSQIDSSQSTDHLTLNLAVVDTSTLITTESNIKIDITEGTYDVSTLLTEINSKLATELTTLIGNDATFTGISAELRFTQQTLATLSGFRFSLRVIDGNPSANREVYFALGHQHKGFSDDEVLPTELGFRANELVQLLEPFSSASNKWYNVTTGNFGNTDQYDYIATTIPTLFNPQVFFIDSPELTQSHNVLQSHQSGDEITPSNHLLVVHNSVNRDEYLQYYANQIFFHELHNQSITHFTLELRNHNNKNFSINGSDNFNCCLVFEYEEQEQLIEQQTKMYSQQGYSMAHLVN